MERYGVSCIPRVSRIQSECGKIRTRITPNTDTLYAVIGFAQRVRQLVKKVVYILRIGWSIDTKAGPFCTRNS